MGDKPAQQTNDAIFLLEALQHVTSPVIINVGEIAAQKDAKVNTVQKRFRYLPFPFLLLSSLPFILTSPLPSSEIKKRYNLNIQITTVGASVPSTPTKPKASPANVTKRTPNTKKKATKSPAQAAKIQEQLEDEEAGDEFAGNVNVNGSIKIKDEAEEMNGGESAILGLYYVNQFVWLTRL